MILSMAVTHKMSILVGSCQDFVGYDELCNNSLVFIVAGFLRQEKTLNDRIKDAADAHT